MNRFEVSVYQEIGGAWAVRSHDAASMLFSRYEVRHFGDNEYKAYAKDLRSWKLQQRTVKRF